MKKTVSNPVMYEAFAGMCKIAKEEGGVMHKVMAIDMGIEFSVFSKLLTGKRPISEHYAAKSINISVMPNGVLRSVSGEIHL